MFLLARFSAIFKVWLKKKQRKDATNDFWFIHNTNVDSGKNMKKPTQQIKKYIQETYSRQTHPKKENVSKSLSSD